MRRDRHALAPVQLNRWLLLESVRGTPSAGSVWNGDLALMYRLRLLEERTRTCLASRMLAGSPHALIGTGGPASVIVSSPAAPLQYPVFGPRREPVLLRATYVFNHV